MHAVTTPSQQATRFTKLTDANGEHLITRDNRTGLEWAARSIGEYTNELNNSEAEKACRELRLGGHDDWRLPTVDELLTLVDRSRYRPAIDTDAFPYGPYNWFWTSTYEAEPKNYHWSVHFMHGLDIPHFAIAACYVRPVRSPTRQRSDALPGGTADHERGGAAMNNVPDDKHPSRQRDLQFQLSDDAVKNFTDLVNALVAHKVLDAEDTGDDPALQKPEHINTNDTFDCTFSDALTAPAYYWTNPDGSQGGIVSVDSEVHPSVHIGCGAVIWPEATIGGNTRIGEGTYIHPNAEISFGASIKGNCVIGAETYIGSYSSIGKEVHVGGNVNIGNAARIGNQSFVGDGTIIGDRTSISRVDIRKSVCIGRDVIIRSSVLILDNTVVGDHVNIGKHSSIGERVFIRSDVDIRDYVSIKKSAYIGERICPLNKVTVDEEATVTALNISPEIGFSMRKEAA